MSGATLNFSNFSRTKQTKSLCFRPESYQQLQAYFQELNPRGILGRGKGLSYSDCCLNDQGIIIDTSRFNHFLEFDKQTGIVHCQGHVTFADLLKLDSEFIPPVLPGTQYASIAGGIANDVHGKNNHLAGSLGHHVLEMTLFDGEKTVTVNPNNQSDLFYGTIGGLGLTGIILDAKIQLKKSPQQIESKTQKVNDWKTLLSLMQANESNTDYQAAWLDMLSPERALLLQGQSSAKSPAKKQRMPTLKIPSLPLINQLSMRCFNQFYYANAKINKIQTLDQFNNPLDKITHWNRLYGKRGLIQFQAVFNEEDAVAILKELLAIIHAYRATPTLAVLKYFTRPGLGLLSFCQPGFTLAIDFVHNEGSREAIKRMNVLIAEIQGRVYLAKDLLLTPDQLKKMYPNFKLYKELLMKNPMAMQSDLARRLELLP